MTTSARAVIYRALKLIRVTARGATPTAAEAEDGLVTLNHLLASMKTLGYQYTHTTLALDDPVTIQNAAGTLTVAQRDSLIGHVESLLAAALCVEYGKDLSAMLIDLAQAASKAFDAILVTHATAATDIGFQYLPSRNTGGSRLF